MPRTNTNSQPVSRRAAIYARVSDKSQAEDDKTSLAEQIGDMEAYCAESGLEITARYQEVGRGWSKSRPEFQRMLADAASGRFDVIVCWKSDRLSRGMYPAAALMEVVEAHRIGLEAVMDAIDMKTFGLMAAIGKIELDNFRERASMGKRGTAKQGRIPVSNVPDGYRIGEARTPEVDEERGEVIRRIFRHYVHDGMGAPAIAAALTDDSVPTAKPGAKWHATQVNRILRNEAYKGTWWYGKARHTATDTGTRVHAQPRDAWIGVPFPPLVDEETWERARVLRERRLTRSPRNTKTFHLLQHLVHCCECGMLMGPSVVRSQSTRRRGKTYAYRLETPRRYYRCYGMGAPYRLRCREHPFIRAERLEALVWGEVRRVLQDPDLIAAGLAALDPDEDAGAEEVARTERELAGVQAEEDRAIRLYVSGKITEQQLDHQRRFIGERLERLRARLDAHRARASAQVDRHVAVEQVVEWARPRGRRPGRAVRRGAPRGAGPAPGGGDDRRREQRHPHARHPRRRGVRVDCQTRADYSVYTMRQASRRSWRIGQTEPVQVVFMAYRNTLQADALKLVAQKLQSSLAVEGELPEDGLAAYGDDGDDLLLALARKIVAGEEDAGSVESVFEQARQVAAEAEALLVDEGWHAPEPEPVIVEVPASGDETPERQRTLFSWAEFMAGEPDEPPKPRRLDEAPTLSLFEWALEQEQEGALAA